MVRATHLWFRSGFVPSRIDLGVDDRMAIVAVHRRVSGWLAVECGVAVAALLAFLALLGPALGRRRLDVRRAGLGAVALLLGLAFTAVVIFLRAGPRGLDYGLSSNSYYAYLFNLPVLIFLSSLVDFRTAPPEEDRFGRGPRVALGCALATLALVSAAEQIRRLREADLGDDFTFCVALDHPGEKELSYVGRSAVDGHVITIGEVISPRHYSRANPKYVLEKRHRGFDVVTCNGRVLGIPRKRWPSDLAHLSPEDEARCVSGATPGEVEQFIDRLRD
jgi:hypothetical protein